MNYYFPAAFMLHSFAMTALMIVIALGGRSDLAADVGLVHGVTIALFYVFSANARNLLLNPHALVSARFLLIQRLFLIVPLAGLAFYLSLLSEVGMGLAAVLILRRCVEWLNEVFMSEAERRDDRYFAINFIIIQSVLLLGLILSFVLTGNMPWWGLLIWALSPLVSARGYLHEVLVKQQAVLQSVWPRLLPHFGSTAIIGITVYVFRLFLVLLTGKETAGDLFTAFALGGIAGSVFANALGPSMVLQEVRTGRKSFPLLFKWGMSLLVLLGVLLIVAVTYQPALLQWTGKTTFFWEATGLSMIGGVIMVFAQRMRLRLLQQDEDRDVFGPDVLVNVLIIASIPFLYWLVGRGTLTALYLISSILSLMFYFSAAKQDLLWQNVFQQGSSRIKALLAGMLFFPIFFQASGGVFRHPSNTFDSGGVLSQLPIPVLSVLACYGGILLLGFYHRARISLSFIFFSFVLMTGASIIATQGFPVEGQAKLIFLIQFILPMFALVMGQLFENGGRDSIILEKTMLYLVALIVPAQLLATWLQGYPILTPYLYLFSIYQNLQYVCVIFIAFYLIALYALWEKPQYRKWLLLSTPVIGIYVGASISLLAMALLLGGMFLFAIYYMIRSSDWRPLIAMILVTVISTGYSYYFRNYLPRKFEVDSTVVIAETAAQDKQGSAQDKQGAVQHESKLILHNANERIHYWQYYINEITRSTKSLLFGNAERPERLEYPSAHNYYLDFIHSFGLLALMPMLVLIGYTLAMIYRRYTDLAVSPSLLGLALTVLFIVLLDNSFKVGLRQPYPGIVTFFLWGVLLTRLTKDVDNSKTS